MPRGVGADVVIGGGITVLAGLLRFIRLDQPKGLIPLDEFYYPVNALGLLRHGVDQQLVKGSTLPAACSSVHLEPAFAVHPPVGKWMMAGGIKAFGCNSFGWRVSAAIVGTLSVLLVYLIARRLLRKPWIAGLAAVLVAIDGLHFVQSRIGMLDIFEAFWVVLAIWLFVEDVYRARDPEPRRPGFMGWLAGRRWWRIGAGFAAGLGVATKWSVVPLLPIFMLLGLFFEFLRLRVRTDVSDQEFMAMELTPAGLTRGEGEGTTSPDPVADSDESALPVDTADLPPPPPPWQSTAQSEEPPPPPPPIERPPIAKPLAAQAGYLLIMFFLIPLMVYIASYTPWFSAKSDRYVPPRCSGQIEFKGSWMQPNTDPFDWKIWNWSIWPKNWKSWVCYQREIFDFHAHLKNFDEKGKPTHPYLSRAWSWPWMGRPTSHYFDTIDRCAASLPIPSSTSSTSGASTATSASQSVSASSSEILPAKKPTSCKIEAEILGLPNPVLWFPAFFLAIPMCLWWAITRRDQVAAMLLLIFAGLFLPWMVTARPLFLFYMTPAVPILALMTAHMIGRAIEEFGPWKLVATFGLAFLLPFVPLYVQWVGTGRAITLLYKVPTIMVLALVAAGIASLLAFDPKPRRLAYAYVGLAMAAFIYFYPVMAAAHIPDEGIFGWRHHMWLQRDCNGEGIKLTCWI